MEIIKSYIIGANDKSIALGRIAEIILGSDSYPEISHQFGDENIYRINGEITIYIIDQGNGYFICHHVNEQIS